MPKPMHLMLLTGSRKQEGYGMPSQVDILGAGTVSSTSLLND
jgi:hypothetical protein